MRFRYKNRFDKERRDILSTITKAGVSAGLLRACSLVGGMMVARATEGQTGPTKSLLLFKAGGALDELWRPSGSMQLGPMSEPYEPVKSEMNFVAGGTMASAFGHGVMFAHFTGNSFTEDSFDVNMGRTIGDNRPLKYLNLGAQCGATLLSRQGTSGVPTIDSPSSAFAILSGNLGGGGGGGGGGGSTNPRRLYVDAHKDALTALRQKLGQHEKEKLDSHLASIEDLESKIVDGGGGEPTPGAACSSITMPAGASGNFDQIAKLQIEIAMLALKCDITSSVSIAFGEDNHQFTIPTYPQVVHQSHHCCPGVADYTITAKYMAGLCAQTISRAKEEGLLDSTLITQVTDMGDGRAHNNVNVPLFVAGGGGAIGRNKVTSASGKNVKDLYQAVANVLGADEHPNARVWSTSPITL